MKVLEIHGSTSDSTILIGESLRNLQKYLPAGKVVIITDTNVRHYYSKDFPSREVIEIGTGEKIKDLDTVKDIYGKLLDLEIERSSFIVGIGGGIVCDIAGFVASTYLRGVRFGFVSSTLLSQVDASIGGKNGVNYRGYKNMVGVFSQPEFVICDIKLLETLPEREILCGFAEVVKHAVIGDADLFSYLEEHYEEALGLNTDVIEKLVYDSIVIKSSIVNKDEKEKGERRKLNFGHTFGHAIEKTIGIPHGEAVSAGMVVATSLSEKRGHLPVKDAERIKGLLKKLNLTTRPQVDPETVVDALRRDKKRKGDNIGFVLLQGIGSAVVEEIPIRELETLIKELF
ncbi:MAG: 3-dehydroquinate synthase [Deltaproteobacteria bacterium]|nr:3-dehydroquinate synthase [Deltaproteobacteria bacterium]MBW1736480.1 3-dehydroquinate synthase [Deltaproteobacteria bacterium]MBW1909886.1 3-dehydroquinate synthase [Deltaproteobacteria bacterium]MBW2032829.1 3-dehydroquinate synthase [Deltaproteobacteria bacterium]MBW2113890.1 3-dehydroquinate synthase [Deltaproteobacteria bacterium]